VAGAPRQRGQRCLDRPARHPRPAAGGRGPGRVRLGIEPEPGNVVRDAQRAAQLLDELGPDAPIGIVLDPANLLSPQTISRQSEILAHAVDLLGPSVISVQAKDVVASGSAAAGAGLMDYPGVFRQLAHLPPVPLIVQDAHQDDATRVPGRSAALVRRSRHQVGDPSARRRLRGSNPRGSCPPTRFPGVCLRPLGQASAGQSSRRPRRRGSGVAAGPGRWRLGGPVRGPRSGPGWPGARRRGRGRERCGR
jgi:hypothetical protein